MKLSFSGFVVFATLVTVPAFAADMPLKAPPPPVWTWTGIYFGLDAGYGAVTPNDPLTVTNNFGSTTTFPTTLHPTGAFAGAEIGANYQFNFLVVGLEADAQAANISGAYNNVFDTPGGNIASRSMSGAPQKDRRIYSQECRVHRQQPMQDRRLVPRSNLPS